MGLLWGLAKLIDRNRGGRWTQKTDLLYSISDDEYDREHLIKYAVYLFGNNNGNESEIISMLLNHGLKHDDIGICNEIGSALRLNPDFRGAFEECGGYLAVVDEVRETQATLDARKSKIEGIKNDCNTIKYTYKTPTPNIVDTMIIMLSRSIEDMGYNSHQEEEYRKKLDSLILGLSAIPLNQQQTILESEEYRDLSELDKNVCVSIAKAKNSGVLETVSDEIGGVAGLACRLIDDAKKTARGERNLKVENFIPNVKDTLDKMIKEKKQERYTR